MTDLRTLLHDAAPEPTRAVDVDALLAEARRRRPWRQRIGIGLAGLGLLVGVGIPTSGVFSPADQPAQVDTAPPPQPPEAFTEPVAEVIDSELFAAESETTTTTTVPADRWDEREAWPPPKEPPAWREGCHVEAGGTGVVTPVGGAGNDDMGTDGCRYVASEAGGYRGSGTWSVTIERDGQKTTYAHYLDSPPCADGVIRPGDIVAVSVRTGGATAEGQVEAGPDVGC